MRYQASPDPKRCSLCVRPALYVVKAIGFCKDHRAEAWDANAQKNLEQCSAGGARVHLSGRVFGSTNRARAYRSGSWSNR